VYQVPEDVGPRPSSDFVDDCDIEFNMEERQFSFSVSRKSTGEVLFDTSGTSLIFESEYLRLRTSLPMDPNLYGLGESADSLRLPTSNYFHTFWNAGDPFLPKETNLYGSHNIYYDHRGANGTHAVFLLSSSGIKVNIDQDDAGQYLEYNSLGGVFDFYFMSESTPKEASIELAATIGYPAMMPYWGFGFHQCRYGYQDVYEVAGVIANYSTANNPLETMWTDIDYMNYRRTLSLDPARFPLDKMRQMIDHLHAHQQHYIVMVDPAVAKYPYTPFQQGQSSDAFLKRQNDSLYTGVVWAGASVFPVCKSMSNGVPRTTWRPCGVLH
jgi:alpha-glucosidase